MISKPHRQNTRFQLENFLLRDCNTIDGAWNLMYSQKVDMEGKLRYSESQRLRREAKIEAANRKLHGWRSWFVSKADKLEAMADIEEQLADLPTWELNLQAAKDELRDIEELMAALEPKRKYAYLPLLEAQEAAQEEEWLGELKKRAQNFMLTQGFIPHDHFNTMRCHPKWEEEIMPHLVSLRAMTTSSLPYENKLALLSTPEQAKLPHQDPVLQIKKAPDYRPR